ncbi:MAG TPA: copper transporter [Streptosporangiaceae bacterium]|nr:copper transporter [Streptosporangiaceae bacterium]
MIDFRYHLVSIAAIFLSLAIGIVLGATALSDPSLTFLKSQTSDLAKENQAYRNQVQQMQRRQEGENQFAQRLGPQLVQGQLSAERVVFVVLPGASQTIHDQATKMVAQAGATVSGQVTVQKKFLDDDQITVLDQLAQTVKPSDITFPQNATPYDKAAAVLAGAVVTDQQARAGSEDASGGEILSGFKDQGFVTFSGKPGGRATLAVVIAPSTPYQGQGSETDNQALVSIAAALDAADQGTVLAGPYQAAQDGGLIQVLRNSGAAERVSTVDTADTPSGQVVTVLALAAERTGTSGKYGTGSGAEGYLPGPSTSPTVEPTGKGRS